MNEYIIASKEISKNEFELNETEISNELDELNNITYKYIPVDLWHHLDQEKQNLINQIEIINNSLEIHNQKIFINRFNDFLKQEFKPDENNSIKYIDTLISLQRQIADFYVNKNQFIKKANSIYIGSNISKVVDAAEELLIKHAQNFYQRGDRLICVAKSASIPKQKKNLITRPEGTFVIRDIDPLYLTEVLTKLGIWSRCKEDSIKIIDNCPAVIAKTLMARPSFNLRVLTGIINTPTLRSDGSILDKTGYDVETGLLFIADDYEFEEIPKNPTKEDALKSLERIRKIFKEFPFKGNASESVALSALFTVVIRKSLQTAPMHCFSSSTAGSGKGLITDVISVIATGNVNTSVSFSGNESEMQKAVLSYLHAGDRIICYDNIDPTVILKSATLCTILTQVLFKGRQLGFNKDLIVQTNAFLMANGINLIISSDLVRRSLLCTIDPEVENPENRIFIIKDLKQYVLEHRAQLINDILTILRAFKINNAPKVKPLGSFETWSDWVRSAIIWLGMPDPCDSQKEIEAEDPEKNALESLLENWYNNFQSDPTTIKEAITYVKTTLNETSQALKDVFIEFAPDRNHEINNVSLGKSLAKFKNRIVNGYRLETFGKKQGSICFRVTKLPKPAQDGGSQ